MSLCVRPASIDDIRQFYPDVRASFRAWVAEIDGRLVGIVGLVLTRPWAVLVSGFDEALRPHLRRPAVMKAIKRVHDACSAHRGMIVAIQEKHEDQSPVILSRLGFRPFGEVDGDIWHVFGG